MTCATIDINTFTVTFHADADQAQAHADKNDHLYVGKPDHLAELSGPQMVSLYNATCDVLNNASGMGLTHVKRFATKEAGIKRIMANLVDMFELERQNAKAAPAPKETKKEKTSAPKAPRKSAGINLKPMKTVYPCREGTKQAILVDALWVGASMEDLLRLLSHGTAWKEVSVKSGLNWDMNKVKGYGIRTEFQNAYERWLECDFESSGSVNLEGFNGHPDDCSEEDKQAIYDRWIAAGNDPEARDIAVYYLVLPEGMDKPLPHTPRKKKDA